MACRLSNVRHLGFGRLRKTHAGAEAETARAAVSRIKELMTESGGKMPSKDVQARLAAEGFTPAASTIPTIRTDFLHSWRMLAAACVAHQIDC